MKTELKHLSAYLPYGLNCEVIDMGLKKTLTLNGLYEDASCVFYDSIESHIGYESVKPCLRPLSDLIKEEFSTIWNEETDFDSIDQMVNCLNSESFLCSKMSFNFWDALLKNHFDIFGLIENGLAIDINTIEK